MATGAAGASGGISQWTEVAVPSVGTQLLGVAVLSPSNAWAVGGGKGGPAIIDHWDGTRWSLAWTGPRGSLYSVKALSTSDIWASGRAGGKAFAVHYNGLTWSPNSPLIGDANAILIDIAPVGPTNVWAVGLNTSTPGSSFITHWDGQTWSGNVAPVQANSALRGAATAPDGSVWAVGDATIDTNHSVLVERWTAATGWTVMPTGLPASEDNMAHGVLALAGNDVWVIGYTHPPNEHTRGLSLHFDGSRWKRIDMAPIASGSRPRHAAALSPTDIWAVGDYNRTHPLLEHWDGAAWTQVASPVDYSVNGEDSRLFGIDAITQRRTADMWAVGIRPFALRFRRS